MIGWLDASTAHGVAPGTPSTLFALTQLDRRRFVQAQAGGAALPGDLIVPQLSNYDQELTAHYGYFGLSSWSIEKRLVDSFTPRIYIHRCFLRLLDLFEAGAYPIWGEQLWASPLKKAWNGPAKEFDLTDEGRASMRQYATQAASSAEESHQARVAASMIEVARLSQLERLYGRDPGSLEADPDL
jgi:hypothetical protein